MCEFWLSDLLFIIYDDFYISPLGQQEGDASYSLNSLFCYCVQRRNILGLPAGLRKISILKTNGEKEKAKPRASSFIPERYVGCGHLINSASFGSMGRKWQCWPGRVLSKAVSSKGSLGGRGPSAVWVGNDRDGFSVLGFAPKNRNSGVR